jgi:hypothetical protein
MRYRRASNDSRRTSRSASADGTVRFCRGLLRALGAAPRRSYPGVAHRAGLKLVEDDLVKRDRGARGAAEPYSHRSVAGQSLHEPLQRVDDCVRLPVAGRQTEALVLFRTPPNGVAARARLAEPVAQTRQLYRDLLAGGTRGARRPARRTSRRGSPRSSAASANSRRPPAYLADARVAHRDRPGWCRQDDATRSSSLAAPRALSRRCRTGRAGRADDGDLLVRNSRRANG